MTKNEVEQKTMKAKEKVEVKWRKNKIKRVDIEKVTERDLDIGDKT